MPVVFAPGAWADYQDWARSAVRTPLRIDDRIEAARRTPFRGPGKPDALKGDLAGFWSRRITQEHRLVYGVSGKGAEQRIEIAACRHHY